MKNIYAFLLTAFCFTSLNATVITSAANGNATSPLTWNCFCIPQDGDTIIINHAVTLDVDYAFTMGGIQVNASGSVTGNASTRIFGVSGGYFINNGTVTVGHIYHNAGSFTNNGSMTALGSLLLDQPFTTTNNGTLNVGDTTYIAGSATLQNNGVFSAGVCLNAGMILNSGPGDITTLDLLNAGAITHNGNPVLKILGAFYNTGLVTLNGSTHVQGDIWNSETIANFSYLDAQSLYTGDTVNGSALFQNNGTISLYNSLFNSETMDGTGTFCVVDSTINSGTINGTLDICDQSGGGWDINIGTEAGTVTHCGAGPCTIGIAETVSTTVGISPNPSNEIVQLQLPQAEVGVVEVLDVTGRVVMQENIAGKEMLLNVIQLPEGLYTVIVHGEEHNYSGRFIKE